MYNSIAEIPDNKINKFIVDDKTPALIDSWSMIRKVIKALIFLPGILWILGVYYHTHQSGWIIAF